MDAQFWTKAWTEGRTAFHRQDFNEKLLEYFPQLSPQAGQRVLVPLCGKTKDLLWLRGQGLEVQGVELHEAAVQAFFAENQMPAPERAQDQGYIRYACENIEIRCGDFFKLPDMAAYDLVYDRAALVALPAAMRKDYAAVITRSLKKGGKCLLIAYEYDQSKMEGPPFSVTEQEVRALYGSHFSIQVMENKMASNEGPRLGAVEGLKQSVTILSKNS